MQQNSTQSIGCPAVKYQVTGLHRLIVDTWQYWLQPRRTFWHRCYLCCCKSSALLHYSTFHWRYDT